MFTSRLSLPSALQHDIKPSDWAFLSYPLAGGATGEPDNRFDMAFIFNLVYFSYKIYSYFNFNIK